jgi:hypothetical protein
MKRVGARGLLNTIYIVSGVSVGVRGVTVFLGDSVSVFFRGVSSGTLCMCVWGGGAASSSRSGVVAALSPGACCLVAFFIP